MYPKLTSDCFWFYLLTRRTDKPRPNCTKCVHRFKYILTGKCEATYDAQT